MIVRKGQNISGHLFQITRFLHTNWILVEKNFVTIIMAGQSIHVFEKLNLFSIGVGCESCHTCILTLKIYKIDIF